MNERNHLLGIRKKYSPPLAVQMAGQRALALGLSTERSTCSITTIYSNRKGCVASILQGSQVTVILRCNEVIVIIKSHILLSLCIIHTKSLLNKTKAYSSTN